MRKSDLKKNHIPFDDALLRYRLFLEKIINAQRVIGTAQEKRDIVESVLLRLCANWERFVDDHLVCCVNRDHRKLVEFLGVPVPAHPSKDLCYALIFGDGYRDFPSFGKLKGFSKKVLPKESNPFLEDSKTTSAKIDDVYAIRNYLAHYSYRSRLALLNMYKNKHSMTRFLEPGQFLLAYSGDRLWKYFRAFESASEDMKKWY